MSALAIKEFESLPPGTRERFAKLVSFGYILGITDVLKRHKTKETSDIALDLYAYGRGINADEVYTRLLELELSQAIENAEEQV